jgi:hypothetical protein
MSLNISDALSDGLSRTFERNGLLLMVGFLLLGAVDAVTGQTIAAAAVRFLRGQLEQLPPGAMAGQPTLPGPEQTPLALPVPLPVAFGLVVVVAFLAEAVRIVAVRTLVSDETEGIPDEFLSRKLLWATFNGFVGGIVMLILTLIGLVFLIVPGVYIALGLFFVRQEIAVEDKNALDALAGSWELTSGHRLRLLALAVVLVVVGLVVSLIAGAVDLAGMTVLTTLVSVVLGAATTVFGVAVAARAYVQLTDEDPTADTDLGETDESEWKFDV